MTMEVKTYPVPCGCGTTHQVRAAQAGSTFPCRCGRTVEMPSWRALKTAAGESVTAPELELTALLREDALPLESACVLCGRDTAHAVSVNVECERRWTRGGETPVWAWVVGHALFGWLGWFVLSLRNTEVREYGRDTAFVLPVRLCEPCDEGATKFAAVRDALRRTPAYARLLDKFPHAKIARPR
jgi:hypothetical protein